MSDSVLGSVYTQPFRLSLLLQTMCSILLVSLGEHGGNERLENKSYVPALTMVADE